MNMTYYPLIKKVISVLNMSENTTIFDIYAIFGNLVVDKYLGRPLPYGLSE